MAYGEIKVDTITFTDGGIDKSVSISGLVQNPTFSGDITVTGTISGDTLQGQTVSGVTVTGTTAQFTSGTFISLTGTTTQGTTSTYTTGSFTSLTGTTTTGTTASFATGVFTSITGITATITSGIFASGTAAAPSVSVGTTDNGLYSPGADEVAISTNGTGRLFVDASGKVGVGTAATASLVTANGKLTLSGAEDNQLEWSLGGQVWRTNMASGGDWYLYDPTHTKFPLTVEKNPISNITIAASSLQFLMTGTERMRLDSSGRLGLGTSSPSQLLHVKGGTNGGIRVEGTGFSTGANIQILNTSNSNTTPSFIGQRTTATPSRGIEISDGTNPHFFVDTGNGRVGIGTTSPGALLHVAGTGRIGASDTSDAVLQVGAGGAGNRNSYVNFVGDTTYSDYGLRIIRNNTGANASTQLLHRGTGNFDLLAQEAAPIVYWTSTTERARIDSSGRLLVGTSSAIQSDSSGLIQIAASRADLVLGSSLTTGISSGNNIGLLRFYGNSGSTYQECARISTIADGTHALNDKPSALTFSTTADGASSPTERMRIKNDGTINFSNVAVYADNAAAKTGGLVDGDVYRTSTGDLKIVYT